MSDNEEDEILREFLIESYENLDQLDQAFVELEEHPEDLSAIAGIFRTIHTIKGTSGFLGLAKLEALTHVGESLLSKLRDGKRPLDEPCTTALLQMVDGVREILRSLEAGAGEGPGDYTTLTDLLRRLQDDAVIEDVAAAPQAAPVSADEPAAREEPEQGALPAPAPPVPEPDTSEEKAAEAARPAPESTQPSISENSVRIDVTLLDTLMNLVGELVLARNQVLQFGPTHPDPAFQGTTQRLNLITSELQEGVMKTRMQPIGTIWNKFPRIVRDLARSCEKKVWIELKGKETELDRTIVEAIKDPLVHIVRNAVDHGIERPEARIAAGKPEVGVLSMRAYHEGGQVNIEIADDGGGIDVERVKARAIEKGVVTRDAAARMSTRDLTNLIFAPGFSTAAKVTNVSGRGVGMDVVVPTSRRSGGARSGEPAYRDNAQDQDPADPAIIQPCQGAQRFIPQVNLTELVRLEGRTPAARSRRSTGPRCIVCVAICSRSSISERSLIWTAALELRRRTGTRTRCSTSWCCAPTSGRSAWSSTRCTTRRRSS